MPMLSFPNSGYTPPHMNAFVNGGIINYSGMEDTYVIAEVQGMGQLNEFSVACPSGNGQIIFEIDGITTTFTNVHTSTCYVYFSSKFPANLTYVENTTGSFISWLKFNASVRIDEASLSDPKTIAFVHGKNITMSSTPVIIVGNLRFNSSLKITMKSGGSISDNRAYGVFAEYSV